MKAIVFLEMINTDWKEIPHTNGYYFVNSSGEIMSYFPGKSSRILKPKTDKCGYKIVTLSINGNRKSHYVHRLVAMCFLGLNPDKPEINHLNGLKSDNRVENLEWVTRSENMQHAYDTGLCTAKTKQVFDDFHEVKYNSVKDASQAWGLNAGTCRNYLNGNLTNKTPLRYGEPIEVHVPIFDSGGYGLLYTRKEIRYI